MELFDVFISHASEDKENFVRALAQRLEKEHLHVWYDEFSLKLGDSLRRSIDIGLSKSHYGIVVLSTSFFKKQWAQRELDALVARETIGGEKIILPIWHQITKEQICEYSPTIADLVAVSSDKGINHVVEQILKVIRPYGSPLIIARDRLIEFGITPPVVTDEWWLDVIEASNRESPWGFVPDNECWGRWTFPLPESNNPFERGERIAFTALQIAWEQEAEEKVISQITPPDQVLNFIYSQPGLEKTASTYPDFLATYAPQLSIIGLGGKFEPLFDELLESSLAKYDTYHQASPNFGSGLTMTGQSPRCDKEIALRHPTFGDYEPGTIACSFVQGEIGGPPCKVYETYDYIIWLLSDKSYWLPPKTRDFLISGMKEWSIWPWMNIPGEYIRQFGIESYEGTGALTKLLYNLEDYSQFTLGPEEEQDLILRTEITRQLLGINESVHLLIERFINHGFISAYFEDRRDINTKK